MCKDLLCTNIYSMRRLKAISMPIAKILLLDAIQPLTTRLENIY